MPNKIDAMVDAKLQQKANAATIRSAKFQKEMMNRTKGMFEKDKSQPKEKKKSPLVDAMERNNQILSSIDKNTTRTEAIVKRSTTSKSGEIQKKEFKHRIGIEKEEREYRKNMMNIFQKIHGALTKQKSAPAPVPGLPAAAKPEEAKAVVEKTQSSLMKTLASLGMMGGLVAGFLSGNWGPFVRFTVRAIKPLANIISKMDGLLQKGLGKLFSGKIFKNLGRKITIGLVKTFKGLFKGIGKLFGKGAGKMFGKIGAKFGKGIAKFGGKALKKIPIFGMLLSIPFAIQKFRKGDVVGGLLELGSGVASLFPGVGTAISVAIDAYLIFRDLKGDEYKQQEGAVLKKVGKRMLYNMPIIGTILNFKDGMAAWKAGDKKEALKLFGKSMLSILPGGAWLFDAVYTLVEKGKEWFGNAPTPEQQEQPRTVGQQILRNLPVVGPIIQIREAWGLWKGGDKVGALKGMGRAIASIFPGGGFIFDAVGSLAEKAGKWFGGKLDAVAENPTVKKIPPAVLRNLPVIGTVIRMKDAKDLWTSGDKVGALKAMGGALAAVIPGGGMVFDLAATVGEKIAGFATSMFNKLPEPAQNAVKSTILRNLPVIGPIIRFKEGIELWKSGDKVEAFKAFGGAVATIIPGGGMIFDVAAGIAEKVGGFVGGIFNKIPEETRSAIGTNILRNLPIIGPVIRFKEGMDLWATDKIGALKAFGGAAASIIPGGGMIFDSVAGIAEWLFNNPIVQGAMDIGKGLLGAAGDLFGNLKNAIGGIFDGAKDLAGKAWEGIQNVGSGVLDGAKGLWNKGKDFFGGMMGNAREGFDALRNMTPEQLEEMKAQLTERASALFNSAREKASAVLSKTKDIAKGLWNRGKGFVTGLFGGGEEGEEAPLGTEAFSEMDLEQLNILKENIFNKAQDIWARSKEMVSGIFEKSQEVVGGLLNRGRDFLGGIFGGGGDALQNVTNTARSATAGALSSAAAAVAPTQPATQTTAPATSSAATSTPTRTRQTATRATSSPARSTATPTPRRQTQSQATASPVRQTQQQALPAAGAADHPYTNAELKGFVNEGIRKAKHARTIEDTIRHYNIAKWANDRLPFEMQAVLPPDPSTGSVVWNNDNSQVRWPTATVEPASNGREEVGDPTDGQDVLGLAGLASVFTTFNNAITPTPVPDEDSEGTGTVTPGTTVNLPGQPPVQRVRTRGLFRRRPRETPPTHQVRLGNNAMPQGLRFADAGVDISGVNGSVWHNFAGMVAEYNDKTGNGVQLNSAYRDLDKQRHLYNTLPSGQAARPGRSLHNWGFALDINSADANAMASERSDIENGKSIMERWGFYRPIQAREPWHIQPQSIDRFAMADEGQRLAQGGYTPPRMQVGDPTTPADLEVGDPVSNTTTNMPRSQMQNQANQNVTVVALSEDTITRLLSGQAKIAADNQTTLNASGPTVNVNGRG